MDPAMNLEEIESYLKTKLHLGYTFNECAGAYNVDRSTLRRWLQNSDSWNGVYTSMSVEEVCILIMRMVHLRSHGATWGIRMIHDHLRRLGYKISRGKVREALYMIQPDLLQWRQQGRLLRREYDVYEPMHVWHMDSHDKLARWGFRIHGCIDGATHYITYMHVCLSKKANAIFKPYKDAIQKFGHPIIMRSDYAAEHTIVEANMQAARPNTNAFRKGPSVHNQRIEAFWRILREKVTNYYEQGLLLLSYDEGSLRIDNAMHRSSLVRVFLPSLRYAVHDFIATWNSHKVRAVNCRGRHRPAHIPELAFQALERISGHVLPPPYPPGADLVIRQGDSDDHGSPTTDIWNHSCDEGEFEAGIRDLENEELRVIRDRAYDLHHLRWELLTCKFKFHLALTYECLFCHELGFPLEVYIQRRLSEVDPPLNIPQDTFNALRALQDTIHERDQHSS